MNDVARTDRLFREGAAVLNVIARRIRRQIGHTVELDDLLSFGRPALLVAAQTFDPERASFATYASRKIRWAILDGVRRETHGRSAVARAMALVASERFGDDFAERSSQDEASLETEEVYQEKLAAMLAGHAAALALGLSMGATNGELTPEPVETPEDQVLRANLHATVRDAITTLPERERALMERHYYENERFDVIATDLGISKSHASRLHASAIDRLQNALCG